jgi:hypothetical protein
MAEWEWFHKFMHQSGSTQHTTGMCRESRRYYTGEYCLVLRYLLALVRSDSLLSTSPLQLWHPSIGDAAQSVQGGGHWEAAGWLQHYYFITHRSSLVTGVTCVSAAAILHVHLLYKPMGELKEAMLHGASSVTTAVFHKSAWIHI